MALTGTKALQAWCVRVTAGYPNVKVENMTKSWKDGLAFCAIIHHFRPELIDFNSLSKKNIRENCTLAFEVAERELNIPALLDPEDMVSMPSPDKLSILTYLSQYYNCFKDKKAGGPPPLNPIHEIAETKDEGVSEKGKEFRKRSFKKAKDKENKAAEGGPLPAKISMKSDKCEICNKRVYLVERQVVDGRLFHRNCFRCTKCRNTLRPDSYKLTKDPKKFECMCHSDGDVWNLRMNPTSRAGARLAGMDDGGTIWQSRIPKTSPQTPQKLPPKESTPVKLSTPAPPVVGNSKVHVPPVSSGPAKPPFPGAVPILHPHLLKSAARARFKQPGSAEGSPQLQRHPMNGSLTSLATQKDTDMAASQESLNKSPADSPARPVPQPRTVGKPQENETVPTAKPSQSSQDTSVEKSTTGTSNENAKENNRESSMFSTDDESKTSSDIRSLQEGDSLCFESSDLENVNDSFNNAYRDSSQLDTEDDTSVEESPVKAPVPAAREIKDADKDKDGSEAAQNSEEPMEVNQTVTAPTEKSNEEDTLNEVNDAVIKEQERGDVEICTNDVTNKSVEEGSSADSALWDTKAELSDSIQAETSDAKDTEGNESVVKTNGKDIEKDSKVSNAKVKDNTELKSEVEKDSKNELKQTKIKVTSKEENYDDSMNPFGSEEDLEEKEKNNLAVEEPAKPEKRYSTNPFESDEEEDEGYNKSLNPFEDDDDAVEVNDRGHVSDGNVNPFTGSPIRDTPFSLRLKSDTRASSFSHPKRPERPPPPNLSSGSYSVKTRSQILAELKRDRETLKKRSAPPPPPDGSPGSVKVPPRSRKSRKAPQPPTASPAKAADGNSSSPSRTSVAGESGPTPAPRVGPAAANGTKVEPVPSPRMKKPERPKYAPPPRTHSQGKRKAPAPPAIKREVGKDHMDTSVIQFELVEIERRQRELEERGVELETKLRQDDDATSHDDAAHDDDLLIEWFDVVNKKNKLVRREGELIAQAQQQELELQHAEIEYELRVILQKQEHERVDADSQREEQLLELLVEVVQKRNQIVERLEEDRLREEAEDRDIEAMMHPNTDKKKDSGKEKKHKKKSKLGLIK